MGAIQNTVPENDHGRPADRGRLPAGDGAVPEGDFLTGCVKGVTLSVAMWMLIGTAVYLI